MRRSQNCEIHIADEGLAIITGPEDLDVVSAPGVIEDANLMINSDLVNRILYDLSQTHFIDGPGLGAVVKIHKLSEEAEKPFQVTNLNGSMKRMLEITGLIEVLDVVE